MTLMHEWVLLSVAFDWKAGRATFCFDMHPAGQVSLIAEGVTELQIPRTQPWGPSLHVNEVRELRTRAKQGRKLEIEMQSGDVIAVTAVSFTFPREARQDAGALLTAVQRG